MDVVLICFGCVICFLCILMVILCAGGIICILKFIADVIKGKF